MNKKEEKVLLNPVQPPGAVPHEPHKGLCESSSEGGRGLLTQARFSQETHAKSLPQEAIVFAPKHLKNLPPLCPVCWTLA